MKCWFAPIVAVAATLLGAAPGLAQLDIRVPFVRVQVGNGVRVQAPFVHIYVPPRGQPLPPPVLVPPPVVTVPPAPQPFVPPAGEPFVPPAPRPVPPEPQGNGTPAPEIVARHRVLSHQEFARSFTPAAGSYEVEMIHPASKQPVRVNFTLPAGQPKVTVSRRAIEFDYGQRQVEIRFVANGRVQVEYHD